MVTKIKDSATAEKAALNLNKGLEPTVPTEPNAPREKGTTERLFPDFMTQDGGIVNRPVPKDVPATETVVVVAPTQTPQTQAPTAPIYIKPEDMVGKMAKLKVDGVEQDVPAEDLFKVKQLERHSISQLEQLAKERAQLERDRAEFLARNQAPIEPPKPIKQEKKLPEVEALESRLAQMEQSIAQERAILMPQIQEAGIKRVEQMAKERTGFDDYRAYHERIRQEAFAEAQKAQAAGDMQAVKFFDSDGFYFQKYQEMKLRDLSAKPIPTTPINPQAPVLQTQQGAPVIVNNNGEVRSIPNFESSSGVPSSPSENQNWQGTYQSLLARAKADPTDLNWMAVMRHKFREGQQ
jgi:hypothetical protein